MRLVPGIRAVRLLCRSLTCASQFFDRLGELFNRRKGSDHGAIYLTQKRRTSHLVDSGLPSPLLLFQVIASTSITSSACIRESVSWTLR